MTASRGGGESLRIGLTGCGVIGALHAKNLAAAGARLRLHNRTPSKAEALARRHGGEVAGALDDLLARCDALVVATPPEGHEEAVAAALAAGCPVLVEKPLCGTPAALERIEAAAATAPEGAFVMVAENYYYKPSLAWMRGVVARAGIGAVTSMDLRKTTRQAADGWKASWGALLEGGIHFVALAADLADAAGAHPDGPGPGAVGSAGTPGEGAGSSPAPLRRPAEVRAEFPTARQGDVERQVRLECVYEDGLRWRLHYAWDVPSLTRGVFQHSRIDGAAGRIRFESNGLYAHLRGPGRKGWTFPGFADLMGYGAMIDDFLGAVAATGQGAAARPRPYSNLARARRDLDIVWRTYQHLP